MPVISRAACTPHEVHKLLSTLQTEKSPGPDEISPRMLKLAAPYISGILCRLFNTSLRTGQLPLDWKSANVEPLHKSGSVNDISNYHHISLCSITCKILEQIVKKIFIQYISSHGLQSPTQHGFWERRSCITHVSILFHHWSGTLDKRNPPRMDAVFLDWSKVFAKVDHLLLMQKLHKFGICGNTLQWLCSYLTNR